jgi:long-chain acyl-CoA synthetase
MSRTSLVPLVDAFEQRGNEIAYVHHRGYRTLRWTYAEVARAARQFARELESRGIAKGDRIVVWGENCAEWVIAFFGCVLRGVIVVPMDRISTREFAVRVGQQVGARLFVCSREVANVTEFPVMVLEELPQKLARHSAERYASPDVQRGDAVEIVFTSGTTAEPKGVVISHQNVLANLEPLEREIQKYLKYERIFHPLRFLNLLPLSHVFGQFLGLFIPQVLGATVIFHDSLNPSEVLKTIKRERVSVCVTVPRLLESLKQKLERDVEARGESESFGREFAATEKLPFWKRWWRFRRVHTEFGWKFWAFVCGGAALDEETEKFWSRLAFAVVQGYGLTETTSLISVNHPFRTGKRSIGKVLAGREVKLDPETNEILVRGENIASGYWQGNELKPVLGEEGWFRTGDLGALDEQGNLYFKGRKKNVIVTPAGMNVYPDDLESALRRETEVRDVVVVGLPVEGNAEPCAVLIMRDGCDAAEAVRRASARLAEFQQIRSWTVWPDEDFPRTSTQKPKTNVIQQYAIEKLRGGQTKAAAPTGALGELIARITKRNVGALDPNAALDSDLGLSSIDRVELMSAIEDRYQVDLNETAVSQATTIGELERMMREVQTTSGARGQMRTNKQYRYPRWTQRWPVTWIRTLVYHVATWTATTILAKPRVIGRKKLSGLSGPFLVVSNHVTYLDIGFVLYALPFRLRTRLAAAMIGERLMALRHPLPENAAIRQSPEKGFAGWFWSVQDRINYALTVALFNVFPLPQRSGFRDSFEYAGESADRGYSILVFPEGKRTDDGSLLPFQKGVGLLANRLNLPVLPMRIDGLFEYRVRGQRFVGPNKITVRIGEPVQFPASANPETIAKELERRMKAL